MGKSRPSKEEYIIRGLVHSKIRFETTGSVVTMEGDMKGSRE